MKDIVLETTIAMAEEGQIEPDVTLIVGGLLISGFVVSLEKYMQHHPITQQVARLAAELPETLAPISHEAGKGVSPDRLHLRDAKFHVPGHQPQPAAGCYMRISLDAVAGFVLGTLQADVD